MIEQELLNRIRRNQSSMIEDYRNMVLTREEREEYDIEVQKQKDLYKKYQEIFSTDNGREVLKDLLDACCCNLLTIYGNDLVYNEGKRYIGNYISACIKKGEEQ